MEILKSKNVEDLNKSAARIIEVSVERILKEKNSAVLGIVGGRSVPGIFYKLKKGDIPWEKVHIFMVDERLVPIDHEESNFRLAEEKFILALISKGEIPRGNVHPFVMNGYKDDSGISAYYDELGGYGGKFDIIILSSGEDGHVGALYPNHYSIKNTSKGFITLHDSPKPPKDRMSASKKLMQTAKVALLIFFGEAKRSALNKFMDKSLGVDNCPAKLINEIKESYVLTDIT